MLFFGSSPHLSSDRFADESMRPLSLLELNLQVQLEQLIESVGYVRQGMAAAGTYANACSRLIEMKMRFDEHGAEFTRQTWNAYVSAIQSYQSAVQPLAEPVLQAFISGRSVLPALEPYLSSGCGAAMDDADVLLAVAFGVSVSCLGLGQGHAYVPTPIRRYLACLNHINLKSTDCVLDLGGGSASKSAVGVSQCQGSFVSLEVDEVLHGQACALVSRSPFGERLRVLQGNFLTDQLPYFNKAFCYEPVKGAHARQLAERCSALALKRKLEVVCFSPDKNGIDDVRQAFVARSHVFDLITPEPDIFIFRSK
jgi:hypothetical protein